MNQSMWYDLNRTGPRSVIFLRDNPIDPSPLEQQVVILNNGALVSIARRLEDTLFVFKIDFKGNMAPLYVTWDTKGEETCALNGVRMYADEIATIRAFHATKKV